MVYLVTGKAGAGKTHYATALAKELKEEGYKVTTIDGDAFRKQRGDTDFSHKGRMLHLIRAARLARDWEYEGEVVVLSFVAPQKDWRDMMRVFWNESRVIYIPGGTLWKGTTYEKPTEEELRLIKKG